MRWLGFVCFIVGLVCSACAPGASTSAQTLIGKWQQEGIDHGMEFYPSGIFVETKPSGVAFTGTYTLGVDAKTVKMASTGLSAEYPIELAGDTLKLLGYRYKRSASIPTELNAFGPPAKLLVGTWVNTQGDAWTYDFYPDGTYVSISFGQVNLMDRYTVAAEGETITMPRNDGSPMPIQVIGDTWLAFGANTYRRVSTTPNPNKPDPATVPTRVPQSADGFQPMQIPSSASTATQAGVATAATTTVPTVHPYDDAVPAGDCGGLEQLPAAEALRIALANANDIFGSSTTGITISGAEAWKFQDWLVLTYVTNPISDGLPVVLRSIDQAGTYVVAGIVPPVPDGDLGIEGAPGGLVPCWMLRDSF